MERLLGRLDRKIDWQLVPPHTTVTQAALLLRMEEARQATAHLAPEPRETEARFSAAGAWHLVATDAEGEVAGALRMSVLDRLAERLTAEDMLRFSHVEFPSDDVRAQHLEALDHLLAESATEKFLVVAGRLFATPAWRGLGLAAVLGVAAIAMARLHQSRFSANFTVVRDRAPELFDRLGGTPVILPDGRTLEPFVCARHGIPLQLLVFDSMRPGLRAERGVDLIADRLRGLMGRTTVELESIR